MRLVRLYAEGRAQIAVDSGKFRIGNVCGWPHRSTLAQAHAAEQHINERDLLDFHSSLPFVSCDAIAVRDYFSVLESRALNIVRSTASAIAL